jgi:hypothetical protein
MESRDTIPFPLPGVPVGQGPFDRGDGITMAVDFSDGRYEATYYLDGEEVAGAYVDELGNPTVEFREQIAVGVVLFKRLLVVFVMVWAHAQELALLQRMGDSNHG